MKIGLFTVEMKTRIRIELDINITCVIPFFLFLQQNMVSSRLKFATPKIDPISIHYERFKTLSFTTPFQIHIISSLIDFNIKILLFFIQMWVLLELC